MAYNRFRAISWKAKIFLVRLRCFFSSQFRGQLFFVAREYFFWRGLHGGACNLGLHLCVSSTRLLAKRHEHVVHVYTWRAERRAKREKRGRRALWRRGARKPVTSNYTARFIIYCRQFLLPPRRCIRPTIEGWFVRRTLSNPRDRSMRMHTCRVRSAEDRNLNFFLDRGRSLLSVLFFFLFSLAREEARKTALARQLCGTIIITRLRKKRNARCCIIGNEGAIEESEMRRPVKIEFHLANAMTSRRALRKTYMLPDIFRYSITATRGIARRARRKNVINRLLAGRDILRARV